MACCASTPPLFNLKLSQSHPTWQTKPSQALTSYTQISTQSCSTCNAHFKAKFPIFSKLPLLSGRRLRFHEGVQKEYASGEEDESLASDATYQEDFAWSSVILPCVSTTFSSFHVFLIMGFCPALGGLLFGSDIGATSGATLSLQSPELSGTTWFNISAIQLGLVVSGSLYGALFGSILVYPIADFLGRRRELIIAAVLYALGGLITAYAPGLSVLLIGRLIYGLGIGLAMHGAPLYIAETFPSQIRGTLVSLKELFIVLGILLGYFVGSLQVDVVGGWRYMFGISAPIALIMGLGMWSLPPSPRWVLLRAVQGKGSLQDYKEKALIALSKLRGRPPGDKLSKRQIEDSFVSLKYAYEDQESEGSFLEVFQGPSLKAFLIGGGLVLFQQVFLPLCCYEFVFTFIFKLKFKHACNEEMWIFACW
ncbi:hypothetical protein FH972_011555 [Carpinus fangiana]|uniref:Major facilitator superfamily (MFS) profile domain-containing protein n=1 Tax=Carpinus fangiana TaxID=176857 RepID=A0A660KRN9_9ROSI|nr:hypothetical protein FH972_011555 [Carpinus fangiana]